MPLCEHHQPYVVHALQWKTGRQFDHSPIIAIVQIFMGEQRKKPQRLEEAWRSKREAGNNKPVRQEGEKMTEDG